MIQLSQSQNGIDYYHKLCYLLRASRVNPILSAYAYLFGQLDFNRTTVAPPGTNVLVHDKPTAQKSFDPLGTDRWYVGPAPEHYRCV